MNYTKEFNTLIEDCLENNEYIGLGNPNSSILFVGKEAGMHRENELTHGTAKFWKKKEYDYSFNPNKLKNLSNTWQNYQKLFECIYDDEKGSEYATFLKKSFYNSNEQYSF